MKKLFAALAAGFVLLALSACNGTVPVTPVAVPKITPAQFFAATCAPVKNALALAPMFAGTIPASVEQKVTDATPMVKAACAQGATVSIANVQQFADTVLPAANAVIQAAPSDVIADSDKLRAGALIALAQLSVDTVTAVAQNVSAAAAASGASAVTPASAPAVAASAPVAASQ